MKLIFFGNTHIRLSLRGGSQRKGEPARNSILCRFNSIVLPENKKSDWFKMKNMLIYAKISLIDSLIVNKHCGCIFWEVFLEFCIQKSLKATISHLRMNKKVITNFVHDALEIEWLWCLHWIAVC